MQVRYAMPQTMSEPDPSPDSATIHILPALGDNYIYLIENNGEAAVIDPGAAAPVHEALRRLKLELRSILLTHFHNDHIGGVNGLVAEYPGVTTYAPGGKGLEDVTLASAEGAGEASFECLGLWVEVIPTPGHTLPDVSFFIPKLGAVFVGDCLFVGGCGRLFTGTAEMLYESFGRLRALPDETKVYVGHEYTEDNYQFAQSQFPQDPIIRERSDSLKVPSVPTTIGEEKRSNVFFRSNNAEELARLRGLKDHF